MKQKELEIAPVKKRDALPEQIVRQLVGLVRSGQLKPGDRLPAERTLAEEFGVGRPTLREALRALQLLGILDIRHGGGVFVAELEPDTLLGPLHLFLSLDHHSLGTILEARKVIEGALLAFVAKTIDESVIKKLKANLDRLERVVDKSPQGKVDAARFNQLAQEFRATLEEAVANPILIRAVKSLDLLSAATRDRLSKAGSLKQLLENHRRMLEALIGHDASAAQSALEAHIDYLADLCDVSLRGRAHA
jgi:GntR family transcriptional regulator, transcriptional repressor for pyruvate dehydrogenase complex